MGGNPYRTGVLAAALAIAAAPGFHAAPAAAQQPPAATAPQARDFDILAQDLNDALLAFANRAGLQIFYGAELVRGLRSSAVSGRFTPQQGLDRLLAGSGLTYRFTGANTVSLEKLPQPGATMQLPAVQVQGANPNAMIGNLPPAYAGGQVARGARLGALGNRDMMDAPFSATAYTAETIRNQQAESIADVLANDPAVRSTYGFGNFSELFVIRGFPLNGDDIAFDGLYGITPRQIVATEMYERVELLRGANAFLNGAAPGNSGIGGNVNLVPKRAHDEPLTRLGITYSPESRVGGSFDVGRRFGPDNAFGARANGVLRGGEASVDDEDRSLRMGALSLDYRGDQFRAAFDFGYQRQRVDQGRSVVFVTGAAVPDAPSASANYAPAYAFSELRDTFGHLRAEYDVTSTIMAYAAFGARDMREDGDYASPTVNGAGVGTVGRLTVPREDYALSGQAGLRAGVSTGPVNHQLDLGFSALRTANYNAFEFGAAQATNLYDPPSLARPPGTLAAGSFDDLPKVSQSDLRSAFFADTASFFGDRVLLTAGFRYQWMEIDGFDRNSGARTAHYDESAISPVVGIVLKATDRISLYANRIEGLTQGPTAPSAAVNVGEVFPPFTSTQYEVGGKVDFGNFGASLALFQTTQPTGITDPVTRVFAVDGEQRNRGIELAVFGEPTAGVRLLGGITVTDSVLTGTAGGTNDGRNAVGVPDYQLNAGAEWDPWFAPRLTLTARVLHTAGQHLDAANTQRIPSWTRLDLGARYAVEVAERTVVFRANVENVSNEAYWASANGGYLTQGLPLTAKLSMTVDF